MTDEQNFFDKPVKSNMRTYNNIRKIETDQEDDCITGCLLDYPYFKDHYKVIAIDLSKQQAVHDNSKAITQINFTQNLNQRGGLTMFFIAEKFLKKPLYIFQM